MQNRIKCIFLLVRSAAGLKVQSVLNKEQVINTIQASVNIIVAELFFKAICLLKFLGLYAFLAR